MEQDPAAGAAPELPNGEAEAALEPPDQSPSASAGAPPPPPPVGALPEPPVFAPEPVPPGTGWSAPAPDPRASTPDRPIDLILPLAVLVVTAGGLTALRLSKATTAYDQGAVIGTTVGALLLAGLFYLIARRFGGPRGRRRARVIASGIPMLLLILGAFGRVAAPQAPTADPSAAMVMSAPYTLADATADMTSYLAASAKGENVAVKQVHAADGSTVAILLSMQAGQRIDTAFWANFDAGIAKTAGASASATQFHGQTARLIANNGLTGLAWVTSDGLVVTVYAKDEASARAIAEAQAKAYGGP